MIKSLLAYSGCFAQMAKTNVGRKLIMSEVNRQTYINTYATNANSDIKLKALREIFNWFLYNQSQMTDDGFGTYNMCKGWTSSYPETTGYIIPTLLIFAKKEKNKVVEESARRALEWLLKIQKPSGGWQSGYIHENKAEIVFNTAQVIRGLIAGHNHFKDLRYLKAAIAASRWIADIQHTDGSFNKHVYMNVARVYESYSVAPLLKVWQITHNNIYKETAEKHIDWIIKNKQLKNGWFQDCDNTTHRNAKPILHTIAYTIDGILDCGLILNRQDYIAAAELPANKLLDYFIKHKTLPGRWDSSWNGTEALITTGCAQMAIIWNKLYKHTKEQKYQDGFVNMNGLLASIHQRHIFETKNTKGAIFGSFPFWGRYEKFSCPNWASKYLADSLILELHA